MTIYVRFRCDGAWSVMTTPMVRCDDDDDDGDGAATGAGDMHGWCGATVVRAMVTGDPGAMMMTMTMVDGDGWRCRCDDGRAVRYDGVRAGDGDQW